MSVNATTYSPESTRSQKNRYLTFQTGEEFYAIDITFVKEIVIMTMKITELPETAGYCKGVINLRGRIIPVIDLRMRFGMEAGNYDEKTCIIVVSMAGIETGVIVERVAEVLDIDSEQIELPPKIGRRLGSQYIAGIGKVGDKVKIILNINKLLSEEEIEKLSEIRTE